MVASLYQYSMSKLIANLRFCNSIHPAEPHKPRILFATREQEILQRVTVNITVGQKLTILDKSNVTIECIASGMPPPSLSWRKDGVTLTNSQPDVFHLNSIKLEDAGQYTCTADNVLGSDSRSAILSVRGK